MKEEITAFMSRSYAFVEVFNQAASRFGRGWGSAYSPAGCSDQTILQALNIAGHYAGVEAGCLQGQCVITYSAWHCDEEGALEARGEDLAIDAKDNPWFKSLPENQGKQE